jgi:hypothetical protein
MQLELAESGDGRLGVLDDHAELVHMLHAVGFGVAQAGAHTHEEGAAVGPEALDGAGDVDEVIVGLERIGERDSDFALAGRELEEWSVPGPGGRWRKARTASRGARQYHAPRAAQGEQVARGSGSAPDGGSPPAASTDTGEASPRPSGRRGSRARTDTAAR